MTEEMSLKLPVPEFKKKIIQIIKCLSSFPYQPRHGIAIFKTGDPGRWPSLTFLCLY